ncbi:sigma-70 family RNA polymerase sigma factor [Bacillus cereus]|uniref:Sigma-70 family RNA polymerase sigma factor n=2 Tax=Bacillus cereus group TaxID=86661 RepID=A0A9W5P2L8_BACCE|nr:MULTISPECIES: sigma-70 family RNA polymerase sigma factor [Bacillus cereus group]MEB8731240.1 sigma-70 family RNA polymerase sigma factor [Bacillus cereus]EEM44064.1 RNA polymerase sigma factor [Bacillus thuringiensis serovar pakistani str. T13001]EJR72000.1 sigma-70 family RNA polymerase sigma factor [Bacillus cereus VD154]KIU70638.1 RNA polymerase sigma factor [Bacillus thuringiensis Sbt003]MEB8752260.1 sigma-70 family RNA polymerase sigma factor [Bacillus cereus]
MTAQQLFEEKQHLVFAAIKQRFGSMARAAQIAEINNMELDDLIQVGHMYLWEHCVKCNPERVDTFNAYVMRGMKWVMSDELHLKGSLFKISRRMSHEERNKINIHSIDYHQEEEEVHGFYAVSSIDVEEEVTKYIEFEEVTSVLGEKEKSIIMHVGEGYTTEEIAMKLEMKKSTVHTTKTRAFKKMNPDYKPIKQKSVFFGRRNRQLGLTA